MTSLRFTGHTTEGVPVSIHRLEVRAMERDIEYWQTRAQQLQNALETRIVIEQAKGVLAERMGCDAAAAFVILRRAARAKRRKLHELAAEVVASTAARGPAADAREVESA